MGTGFGLRQLCQPEVQNLYSPILREEKILRLEVAMNDAFLVGCGQTMRDVQGVVQSFPHCDGPAAQALSKRLSLKQL